MKQVVIVLVLVLMCLAGCSTETADYSNSTDYSDFPVVPELSQEEISLFDSLFAKAQNHQSFQYTYSDSDVDEKNYFMIRGRWGIVKLEESKENNGEPYDKVYFDRVRKVALARCTLCEERDLELDLVDYSDFYQNDPVEVMYKFYDTVYAGNELMYDRHYCEVFNATFVKKPAKIWLQEYAGLPLKIEAYNNETFDVERTIEFLDLMYDNVRMGEIMPPFNYTVRTDNETKNYMFGWYGYLAREYDEVLY